ncbi:hypothetical protein TrVE_jg12200 [Triparma verrucosa]|nr:hypothetical protein TrVE_jg12200 [Triparma verrucosa]
MNTTMTTMTNDHDSLNTTSNTLNTFLSDAASTDLVAKSSDDSEQFKIKNLDTGDVHDVRGKDSPESRKRPSVESSMKSPQTKFVRLTPVNSGSIISSSSFGSRASSDFSTSTMEIRSLKAQLKRKDKYILHLAKTLRSEKHRSKSQSSPIRNRGGTFSVLPLTPRSRKPPSLKLILFLTFLSFLIVLTLIIISPHFSLRGLCAPYRRGVKAEIGFKQGPWATNGRYSKEICGGYAVSFNFTPPVLTVITNEKEVKFFNVEEFRMGARGGEGTVVKRHRWLSMSYIRWGRREKKVAWRKKSSRVALWF